MKNEELRKIIAECVQEVIQEQGVEEGFWSNVGKGLGITNDPESGTSHYDRFTQMHNKRADYKKQGDYDKFQTKQSAENKVEKLQAQIEVALKKTLRDAFIEAESVEIQRKDVRRIFQTAIQKILDQYKRLEEKSSQ